MNNKNRLKKYMKSTVPLYFIFLFLKKMKTELSIWIFNDKEIIIRTYKKATGIDLNLDNPLRFTEKIQWLKLNYFNANLSMCSDKLMVRKYVEEKGYGHILNELIGVYSDPDEIDLNQLPEKFVLKTTHASGWNIVCSNKNDLKKNWFWWKKIMKFWLKEDYSKYYGERHYSKIEPRIICEKFLGDSLQGLNDYKFFCFNGSIKLIEIDIERYTNHKRNYYDENLNFINYKDESSLDHFDCQLYKPEKFDEMKNISQSLSEGFPHARIDLYEWDNKIYFGEFTFFDGSGYYKTEPEEFDYTMGEWLRLPIS